MLSEELTLLQPRANENAYTKTKMRSKVSIQNLHIVTVHRTLILKVRNASIYLNIVFV